jgi:hypothetical protein
MALQKHGHGSDGAKTLQNRGVLKTMKKTGALKMYTTAIAAGVLVVGSAFANNSVDKPTFAKDVAPIMFENCAGCHSPGQVGPMSLLSYEEVRPWVKSIQKQVEAGKMPPWHADEGYGPFANDRSLSEDERETILKWAKMGAPLGNKADLPPAPKPADDSGWKHGEPDVIYTLEEITVPGNSPDQFYDIPIETDLGEDKWITGLDIKPGNSTVVHHVILWEGRQPGQGWLGAWAAGATPDKFPEGTGRLLKKGATILADMHYHPTETDATDVTQVGLYFAEDPDSIKKELTNLWVMNTDFVIPPGDSNYQATSTHTFPQDSTILSVTPHMHYRGKDFKYTATFPDGTSKELLKVSNYDFNWQTVYWFEEPVKAPKGTRIDCVAHWDNSENNPFNPDPTKTVTFGPESYDEMMIGFVDYIVDEGVRPKPFASANPIADKLPSLIEKNPGDVYKVMIPGQGLTALVIPKAGGVGGWHVAMGERAVMAPVTDIAWNGDEVTAKLRVPGQGVSDISATLSGTTLSIALTDEKGETNEITGMLAQ